MSVLQAIVLGITQGLSEFLPISSSGHLILVRWIFGWEELQPESVAKAFDVALHIGTLVAVVAYFRRDLVVYVREGLLLVVRRQRPTTREGRLAWLLVLSAVPAALAGALFESVIEDVLGAPWLIAVSLIVFGLLLGWADRRPGERTLDDFGTASSLQLGAAQALALNPGTSRSGITITAARMAGYSRDAAARISFLMSIPVIVGAVVFKLFDLVSGGIPDGLVVPLLIGIVASGLSGWLAVWGTIALVRTRSFMPFVVYRCILGVVILVLLATGVR